MKFNGQNMVHFILPSNKKLHVTNWALSFILCWFFLSRCSFHPQFWSLWKYYVTLNGLHLFFPFFFQSAIASPEHFSFNRASFTLFPRRFYYTFKTHPRDQRSSFQTLLYQTMNRCHWIQMHGDSFFLLFVLSKIRCLFNAFIHIELK